jgi:hypothetical protein
MNVQVIVKPASSRNKIEERDGTLYVWTTKPAVDGAANSAVVSLLSKHFHVPKSSITIIRGATSRTKLMHIDSDAG